MLRPILPLSAAPNHQDILSALQTVGSNPMLNALGLNRPPVLPIPPLNRPTAPTNPIFNPGDYTSSRTPVNRDYVRDIVLDHKQTVGYIGAK